MKKIYILAASLLSLLAACKKDDSSSGAPLPAVKVSGLQTTYTLYTHQDILTVQPVVENENAFDYYWTLFNTAHTANQGLVKADTLAKTKDLNYEVLKDPGSYILVFNVKDKQTGITTQFRSSAIISTLNMTGWYLLKDHAGKTDLDFIYNTGRIDNWISFYNGASLDGNAVKALFVPGMKKNVTAPDPYNTIMVLSENDAAIYRIDNGNMVMNYDNMFFTKPAVRKPQGAFQPTALNTVFFLNNGRTYYMSKGTLFANMPTDVNNINYTNIGPVSATVAMELLWNKNTKSIFAITGANYSELKLNTGGGRLMNLNAELEWAAGYPNNRGVALLLFRNPQDTGFLYKVDGRFSPLGGYPPDSVVMARHTLKPEHSLMHAGKICGNYDVDIIYYSVGSDIYMMDLATQTPTLQFSLPAGEELTAFQHIKYPVPASGVVTTENWIVIATHKDGRYKIYKHAPTSTFTLQAKAQADIEGEGRVSSVIYMEQGNGTRSF
jgi:hypothetical protein